MPHVLIELLEIELLKNTHHEVLVQELLWLLLDLDLDERLEEAVDGPAH